MLQDLWKLILLLAALALVLWLFAAWLGVEFPRDSSPVPARAANRTVAPARGLIHIWEPTAIGVQPTRLPAGNLVVIHVLRYENYRERHDEE